ncbi:MAG: hypothetical protein FJY95_10625 [Candidatus Handelsmanbacteria bacterium]|nr:hypothetical protein [Candidatus Handelsmanbacteria bacterium]
MKGRHLGLLALLLLLVLAEYLLEARQQTRRQREEVLRPLIAAPGTAPQQLQVQSGAQTWTYVRRGAHWRYPGYFDAFAQAEGIEYVLEGLLRAPATVYAAGSADLTRLGLDPERALRFRVEGEGRALLAEVWIGQGIPGPGAQECYARPANADTVFHLHANPRLALGRSAPPLLDNRVLPAALGRRPVERVEFSQPGYPLRALRRLQMAPAPPPAPGRPPQLPAQQWRAAWGGQDLICGAANALAYAEFLGQLRWAALLDPRTPFAVQGQLQLRDEADSLDVLEVGPRDEGGRLLLRHQGTGLVGALDPAQSALLFPTRQALLDTLPGASPYRRPAPGGF